MTGGTLALSFRAEREIFVIRGEGLTLFPHVPSTSPLSASVFPAACALSAPMGHLPLEGKADDTRETYLRRPSGIASYILAAKPPPPFLISHFSFLIQARFPSPMKGQHAPWATPPTSFTTKSCALHSSLFYFFPFLTTVFASAFASALPRPRLPVFASFFAVMYQAGDLSKHLFCFTVGSFGYCFL